LRSAWGWFTLGNGTIWCLAKNYIDTVNLGPLEIVAKALKLDWITGNHQEREKYNRNLQYKPIPHFTSNLLKLHRMKIIYNMVDN